jgi:alpha-D-ribose 1-methylphosphonate 5-triphosphate synthase subunit PhnI
LRQGNAIAAHARQPACFPVTTSVRLFLYAGIDEGFAVDSSYEHLELAKSTWHAFVRFEIAQRFLPDGT